MSSPPDGPLRGWLVASAQTASARAAAQLLVTLGAAVDLNADGDDELVLTAPGGARRSHRGLASTLPRDASLAEQRVADWAVSGAAWLTGRRSGPPLVPPGSVASVAGGAGMAYVLLAAHLDTNPDAVGRPLELDGRALLGERGAIAGLSRRGPRSCGGGTRFLPTCDGVVALTVARDADLAALPALVHRESVAGWPGVRRWSARQPAAVVVARAGLLGLGAGRLPDPAGAVPPAYRLQRLTDAAPWSRRPGRATQRGAAPLVVDLTGLWAGPLAGQLLTRAGARVVKVEATRRPDGARRGPAAFFDLLHAGQLSVALPLHAPSGLAALRELVGAADLVLEAARPRVRTQWGLRAEDSGGSWLAVRAYDRSGPDADRAGFGDDVALAAGLAVRDPDGRWNPVGDAIADPVAGVVASVAALATLVGDGRWEVETSLQQAVAQGAAAGPGIVAHRAGQGWAVDVGGTEVAIRPPVARLPSGRAGEFGADTDAVLADLVGGPAGGGALRTDVRC